MKNNNGNKEEAKNGLKRRGFLKMLGFGGALAVGAKASPAMASENAAGESPEERKANVKAVLVDTTLCVGCRACEGACNEANNLPKPQKPFDDESVLNEIRDMSPTAFTVVNAYKVGDNRITRKRQCMHCLEPACSSACIIRAMEKQPTGPVTYRDDLCLGCRYCMVACPHDVPKFEYTKAMPLVKKCQFCFNRQKEGKSPACVEACPMGALTFGTRGALLDEAKKRIYTTPDNYIHHIYGENEAGGTSWLYLANVPFEKLGLPKLSTKPYPEYTAGAMAAVPMVMLLWPALLMGFHHFSHNGHGEESHGHE